MAKSKIAHEKEVLAMLTGIMRGEVMDYTARKTGGTEELIALPPKVSDRMHAAEYLAKYWGLGERAEEPVPKGALAAEIEALAGRLRRETDGAA